MMEWVIGFGIEYFDGGAPSKLEALSRQTRALTPLLERLTTVSKSAAAGIWDIADASKAASAGLGGFSTAARASAAASSAATSAHRAQAAGLWDVAAAANAAAGGVLRFNAMTMAGGAGGGARAASAAAFGPAAALALPSGMKYAGASMLASSAGGGRDGWMSPWAAGLTGDRGGRGGAIPIGAATYEPPNPPGGGGRGGGGGGGRGPGGGGSAGGGLPFLSGTAAHMVLRGAMYTGLAGVGLGGDALYEAGKLQQQMTLIQVATNASAAQKRRLEALAFSISDMTAQSAAQSAGVIGVMASAGINDPEALMRKDKNGRSFAEIVAKFADVQYLKTGGRVSFAQGSKELIQLAHLYRAYKPDEISHVADQVTKLSFMMPDGLDKYLTQAGYYVANLSRLGVPQDQSLVLGAFLDRVGLGRGKGGTGINAFVSGMMKPLQARTATSKGAKAQLGALEALGIYGPGGAENPAIFKSDKQGHSVVDIFAALAQINKSIAEQTGHLKGDAKAKKERELIGDFQRGFGVNGARFGLESTDKSLHQLLQMVKNLNTMPGVEAGQSMFMKNYLSQQTRSWSNFQSLATEVGGQAIPGATKAMKDMGDAFHFAQGWLHQHGELEKHIQHDILAGVKGTEQWLVSYHDGWVQLRGDLWWAYNEAKQAGPQIKQVAEGIGSVYQAAHELNDALNGIQNFVEGPSIWEMARKKLGFDHNEPQVGTGPDGHPTYSWKKKDLEHHVIGWKNGKPVYAPAGNPNGSGGWGGGTPHAGGNRQHTVRHVHEHRLTLTGGHSVARHEVRRVLEDVISEGSDPRGAAGRHGSVVTSPYQPTQHTTPNPP